VEELRGQIAQLTERLARAEERLSRLVIARETIDEVLSEADAQAAAAPEETAGSRFGHLSPIGALSVPPWQAGLEASALPESYRDLVEVVQDAVLSLRAVIGNGDFEEYWHFHLAREHQRLYPGTAQGEYTLGA
jgi:hypothetical protein